MVTKDETGSATVSRGVRGILAYLINLLLIYLALSLVFAPLGGKYFLDYTIVRGVCLSCMNQLFGELFLAGQLSVLLFVLVFSSIYEWMRHNLLDKTLGEKLMRIRFDEFIGDGHQPFVSWLRRASWLMLMIIIPFGFKVIFLPLTVIVLLKAYLQDTK